MPTADGRARRVLMTADAVGGVWTYALELARGLAAHGIETLLAVLGPAPSDTQRADARSLTGVHPAEWSGRLEWMDDPWDDVQASGRWLMTLTREWRPDVVHLNGYTHGSLPWPAPVLMAGHSCVRSWWRAVEGGDAPARFDRYGFEVARGLRAAGLVVAPSAAMLAALEQHYAPLPPVRVIPNGRTPVAISAPKEPFVLTAGRLWDAAKNVAAVCDVAATLTWPVYAAGADAPDTCSRGVTRLGPLEPPEMARWMARASIYALPARYEPFGLSVLEAAQAGCALVLGDIDSLRENWNDAAIFVPPDDRRALSAALQALISDEGQRCDLAARAQERSRHFTVARMARAYRQAYTHLLTERRTRGDAASTKVPAGMPDADDETSGRTRTDLLVPSVSASGV